MKLPDAMKQATPGLSVGIDGDPTCLYGKMPSGETCRIGMIEERSDAALLKHWYNHGYPLAQRGSMLVDAVSEVLRQLAVNGSVSDDQLAVNGSVSDDTARTLGHANGKMIEELVQAEEVEGLE